MAKLKVHEIIALKSNRKNERPNVQIPHLGPERADPACGSGRRADLAPSKRRRFASALSFFKKKFRENILFPFP